MGEFWGVLVLLVAGRGQTPQGVEAVRAAFEAGRGTFEAYREGDPESEAATREALVEVFRAGTLDELHALLRDGTIDSEMSRRLAGVRNGMIEDVREEMARKHGEVHVSNFSPAVNLLGDIDGTFWASPRLAEQGIQQSGTVLKADFDAIWKKKYGLAAHRSDVVSHTSEAGIPDWRKASEVHTFVSRLRKGSRLLESNPEAYFLEGGFRMQVERRSFASELELYSIYSRVPRLESGVAKYSVTVERHDGTIGELAYKNAPPEVRRGYAAGSTIGNWWFLQKHGGGTRYAAKYGLRSFSEGPGFMETWDKADTDGLVVPREYEKIESYAERQAYCDDVWATHFRESGIRRAELWNALETARVIRNAGDSFRPEMAFERRALEMVGGSRTAYLANRDDLLARADLEYRAMTTRVMIRNIEVAVPARLADWLDPHVNPRQIGLSEEDIRDRTPHYEEEMAKARKRLRVAALFETMRGLRALEPELRARVLESAVEDLRRKAGTREGERYPFERAVRAVAKLAGAEAVPHLLQIDSERVPPWRYRIRNGLLVEVDGESTIREVPLAEQVDALRRDLETALAQSGLAGKRGTVATVVDDLGWRWSRALAESEDTLRAHVSLLDPRNYARTKEVLRATLWNQLGWRAESEWHGMGSLAAPPNVAKMTFDGQALLDGFASVDNAQSVLNLILAFRGAPDSPGAKGEAVRAALLLELASRLPYVGDAIQVAEILEGRSNPLFGTGLMVATFVYPGIGQMAAVYSLVDGTSHLLVDLGIEGWVATIYQGNVPNDDGSPGPGRSTSPIWHDVRGVLEPVRDWMLEERARLLAERASAEDAERAEIDHLLATRFPAKPTVRAVRDSVYAYYSRSLLPVLKRAGATREELPAIQLQSFGDPPIAHEPAELVDTGDLPILLRAYVRPIVRAYFEGTGDFATLPAHVAAHAHPLLAEQYFHSGNERIRGEEIDHLTTSLAAAYMRAILSKARGGSSRLIVDPRWDTRALVGADAYLHGLPASSFEGMERQHPEAGPVPPLPALFDLFPPTHEGQVAPAFDALDEELNNKILGHFPRLRKEPPLELDAFKLGEHAPLLDGGLQKDRSYDEAYATVAHPLLLAFFNRAMHEFLTQQLPEVPGADTATDGSFALPPLDTRSVGPSATTDSTGNLWRGARLENALAQADLARIQAGVVQFLIRDYKQGLLQSISDDRDNARRRAIDAQLPAMEALLGLNRAFFGDREETQGRAAAGELGRNELPSPVGPVSELTQRFEDTLRAIPKDVELTIEGAPSSPLGLNGELELSCQVEASDLYFDRPYRVEWLIQGLDEVAREKTQGASESEIEERVAFAVGTPEEGIEPRTVIATAVVTDATGLDMGSASVSFQIDPLSVEEEEESDPPAPSASLGSGEGEEEPEPEVELVAYVIRVEGSGWVPHYRNGSYVVSGSNEEVLWVKNGEDAQALIDAYRDRLDTPPCEVEVPASPLQQKRPVLWDSGPWIKGVQGPIFDLEEVKALELKSDWVRSPPNGPGLTELREMFGCN